MNVKLKVLRKVLEEAINNIDAGNSNHSDVRLYSEWFRNINKNELDNKIIESAITFYFKDEDSGSTKTWNYFKTAN